jgi:hypothetical protein
MPRFLIVFLTVAAGVAGGQAADSPKPLNARAREIEKMKSSERNALDARCRIQANWKTPDCIARIEVEEASAAEWRMSVERERKYLREDCAAGDQEKCIKLACPSDARIYSRTAAEVRACARASGLPITAKWAQTSESLDNYQHRFGYVCLEPIHFVDPYGVKASVFAGALVRWFVTSQPGPKKYEEESIKDRTFPTKEAAATAGCVAEIPRHREFLKLGGLTPVE